MHHQITGTRATLVDNITGRACGACFATPSRCAQTGYARKSIKSACAARSNHFNQGYELTEDEINISLDDFRAQYGDDTGGPARAKMAFTARPSEQMLKRYTPITRPGEEPREPEIGLIHVEFSPDPNVGIKQLKQFAQLLDEKKYFTGVFITGANVTPSALKIIPSLLPTVLEIFKEDDLLVNISKHELVPKHVLLSAEEKRYLLSRYRLKETQLPRIRIDDPMAKYLGLRRAQVVKIIRKSETAGRYASYRWVI